MAKIMEQPIVDFLRQQLNFSGFPLPSVSEDENHLIVYASTIFMLLSVKQIVLNSSKRQRAK